MKIFLSPSNQDGNTWAINNTNEMVQATAFADKLETVLKQNGIEVVRADKVKPTERIAYAEGCDLYIPLHTNAHNGEVRGCRLFVYRNKVNDTLATKNDKAMKALRDEIDKLNMPEKVRLYYDYATWFELTNAANRGIPAVYSESIFHDNVEDCKWYFANLDKFVNAYAKGICNYFGVAAPAPAPNTDVFYRVQLGAFKNKAGAESLRDELVSKGIEAFVTKVGDLWKVQVGAFKDRNNATIMVSKVKAMGYEAFVTSNGTIKKGCVVRVKPGAKAYDGSGLADFVYTRDHIVKEINGDRAVITYEGIIVAAMKISDLIYIRG